VTAVSIHHPLLHHGLGHANPVSGESLYATGREGDDLQPPIVLN